MFFRQCARYIVGSLWLITLIALPHTTDRAFGNVPTGYEKKTVQPAKTKPKSWPRQYGEYKNTTTRERGAVRLSYDENNWYSSGYYYRPYYGYWRGYYGWYRPYGWYGWHSHHGY